MSVTQPCFQPEITTLATTTERTTTPPTTIPSATTVGSIDATTRFTGRPAISTVETSWYRTTPEQSTPIATATMTVATARTTEQQPGTNQKSN